jgi:hypothetical protein
MPPGLPEKIPDDDDVRHGDLVVQQPLVLDLGETFEPMTEFARLSDSHKTRQFIEYALVESA